MEEDRIKYTGDRRERNQEKNETEALEAPVKQKLAGGEESRLNWNRIGWRCGFSMVEPAYGSAEKKRVSRQEAVQRLQENPTEENLWSAVIAFQGYFFKTATGLPFRYKLKIGKRGNWIRELWIDRREKSKSLSWGSLRVAFENALKTRGEVSRPKDLGDIRGISYIYPMLWCFGIIDVPEKIADNMSICNIESIRRKLEMLSEKDGQLE